MNKIIEVKLARQKARLIFANKDVDIRHNGKYYHIINATLEEVENMFPDFELFYKDDYWHIAKEGE